MEPQKEYVLRTVEERGVRLIRLWFTDVLGKLKSVAISPAELEGAFEEGLQFDGSASNFPGLAELANLRGFEPVHSTDISENKIYQLEEMGDK